MNAAPTKKKLTSLDEMFQMDEPQKDDKNTEIEIEKLVPFKNHPFKYYTGERLDDMIQSIKEFGILQPILVRQIDDEIYEILAGHNRWNAALNIGLSKVPIIIMDGLSDEEALLIVTETNLIQRSFTDLLHSERAFVLTQHYEALKSQGKRIDLISEVKKLLNADKIEDETTCAPVEHKLKSREVVAQNYNLSRATVARYLRINTLDRGLKDLIDTEQISIRASVELSYLTEENQIYLVDILNNNNYKVDIKKATELRELEKASKLNEVTIEKVLAGTYNSKKKVSSILNGIKIKSKVIKKYFTEQQSEKEVEDIIDKALELYYSQTDNNNRLEAFDEVTE
ncbi:ParB/RepB/Spo0J family partition protein [Anaeromicropila herbilytica]|uniref:Chromosome partitioning protein ParB n=1 Tax=Anaeromicropila herbilytica TaxID=2785025 RepID=A0A7R7EJC3_9FIRM|nr:ParB/RepB/Spo0J family partition protein [Anaeromicropila herbilytica]BCN29507.1 chromosome partitioning protein ParB [Anaeromicropila herbilytica]